MKDFILKIRLILEDKYLSQKIFFVIFALILFRIMANIPIPAAAGASLDALLASNQALGFLNILTGGGLSAISIVMLGVGPYITASIIMQLLTMMSERLKTLYHEEGEVGRRKFMQISRRLTIPLSLMQGYGLIWFLHTQGVIPQMSAAELAVNVIIVSAGSMVLMWIGELISEFGIGNGVSLIIFAGIVAGLPSTIGQLWFTANPITDPSLIPLYVGFVIAAIAIMLGVVTVTEAERPVPITYAKKVRGTKTYGGVSTYLPIRVNQAGVIPIIFALSLLIFPQVIVNFMSFVDNETIQRVSIAIQDFLANTVATSVIYFFLVFAFTFFYTAVTFDPDAIATNLQKSGAFVPGVRPGHSTSEYLAKVLSRITFIGATFLSVVAVLPFAMIALTGVQGLAIGGTALLIVVSVVLDLVKKIDAQLSMREY